MTTQATGLPSDQENVLAWMGLCLVFVQHAESTLKHVLAMVFPDAPDRITIESLESDEFALRKKTLGQLIKELEKRAVVDPNVESQLGLFLQHRNEFAHSFTLESQYALNTDLGRDNALRFVQTLGGEAYWVAKTFGAVLLYRMEELEKTTAGGLRFPWEKLPPELDEVRDLMPLVPHAIRPRDIKKSGGA